jgi:diguanylate cyclase (GGDEF)-like protein
MRQKWSVGQPWLFLGLALAYLAAGELALRLSIVHPSVSPVSVTTGIALAALVLGGTELWAAIFVGALLVHLANGGSLATSFGIAMGSTLEAFAGALLVRRWANGRQAFEDGQDVIRFTVLAGLCATAIAATLGVASLGLFSQTPWRETDTLWLTWWLSDAAGALLVAPPLFLWFAKPTVHWSPARTLEAVALGITLIVVSALSFGPLGGPALGFLCVPALIWAALRFGPREAATAITLVFGVAVLAGAGAFFGLNRDERYAQLLLLQTFTIVTAVTILVLAAVVAERRRGEEALRELATTDPHTGLANYRVLIATLQAEIRRFQRTKRPFSLLFFDLDNLKGVNDRYGHLAGSRALRRLAEAIRQSCRAIDTPARYGGDEFAVILPETEETDAKGVARRMCDRLAADQEVPPLTTSVGVAVFPRDGDTVEKLVGAADQALYGMKKVRGLP